MQLKHLNLATSDVGGLASFFERFFGFERLMTRGQDAFALMCNQDEFVLTLMKAKKHYLAAYPETFHVGFYLDAADAVQAKHNELAQASSSGNNFKSRAGRLPRHDLLLQCSRRGRDRDRHAAWTCGRIAARCQVSQARLPRAVTEKMRGMRDRPVSDARFPPDV